MGAGQMTKREMFRMFADCGGFVTLICLIYVGLCIVDIVISG